MKDWASLKGKIVRLHTKDIGPRDIGWQEVWRKLNPLKITVNDMRERFNCSSFS